MTSQTCASGPAAGPEGHLSGGNLLRTTGVPDPESENTMNANPLAVTGTASTPAAGSPGWRSDELSAGRSGPVLARAVSGGSGLCCVRARRFPALTLTSPRQA